MEKPSDLSGVLPKFPGSHGGQPPDSMLAPSESVVSSEEVQVLERHGSPIPSENMPVTKRGRTGAASEGVRLEDGSEPTDTDTNMGEVDAATNLVDSIDFPTLTTGPSLIPTGHVGGPPKPSFRDSLLGRDGTRTTDHLISELDVEVTDDDDPLGCEDVECQVSNGTVMQLQAQPRNLNATSLHKGKETITSISHGIGHSGPGSSSGGIVSEHLSREMVIDLDVNPSEAVEKDVSGALLETGKDVASSERVVYSEVTLNKENHTAIGYRLACHRKTGSAMAMLFGSLGFPCFVGSFGNDAAMRFLAGYFVGRCVGAICYPLCAADLRISRQQNSSIRC
ncbi:hypothetical protein V6N11_007019 [Hibiscus sabdariffa]|uniref:Uncharacterized protein n=1 Tax=Hibiscus sabdariffa TaxID=183260 RepID=A0ABR2RSN9_9ROSI